MRDILGMARGYYSETYRSLEVPYSVTNELPLGVGLHEGSWYLVAVKYLGKYILKREI